VLAEISMLLLLSMGGVSDSLLGSRLEQAKQKDFFTFFKLKETGAALALEKTSVISFKPEGAQFRELVSVYVTLDTDSRIVAIDLVLARAFVDHKTNGIFARDIAKSLLRSAVPEEDLAAINDLANEIEYPPSSSGQTVLTVRPPPNLPARETAGYLVYLGKGNSYERTLSNCTLKLANRRVDEVDSLLISVAGK